MTQYEIALKISQETGFIKKNILYDKSLHWRYIYYRIARPLLKLNYKIYKTLNAPAPWTSQASIKIFRKILHPDMVGFEYGSGRSTLFFAKLLKQLTSVEHNKDWFNIVRNLLNDLHIKNVDYHLIPASAKETSHRYFFYEKYNLTTKDFQVRTEYHDYFSFISGYPDHHFDFIIVDGRARVECALLSIDKLKPGAIFVLDNSDRARYQPVFDVLKDWKKVTTTTGLFDTTIWFKP